MDDQEVRFAEQLVQLVEKFNIAFGEWSDRTGCVAGFGWKYSADKQHPKALEVQSIDRIVYRKPPPSYETMAEMCRDKNKV